MEATPSDTIIVASCSLHDLLSGAGITGSDGSRISGQLTLPEYQRPYRWRKRELAGLLADLRDYFSTPKAEEISTSQHHDFYLGSIILHQTSNDKSPLLNIIDGQQRLTTMALLAWCWNQHKGDMDLEPLPVGSLAFSAPESQNTILANLKWLQEPLPQQELPALDYRQINITLVVTRSEDDAYRFFETQNSGGVRLEGPDIIKAHHLRAIHPQQQDNSAREWEKMKQLPELVDLLMKGRLWQSLQFREQFSHRDASNTRKQIVEELASNTDTQSEDMAYRPVRFLHTPSGWCQHLSAHGYALRQPLNAGHNTVHYLRYFHGLKQQWLVERSTPGHQAFFDSYKALILNANGSPYLKKLYDSAILLYLSQFGDEHLYEASLWLFRAVYSPRLSNQKTVRESSVQAFARSSNLLDWIATSFNHQQLIAHLRKFPYTVDSSNLDENSVKKRFVTAVAKHLSFDGLLQHKKDELANQYDEALKRAIPQKISQQWQEAHQ